MTVGLGLSVRVVLGGDVHVSVVMVLAVFVDLVAVPDSPAPAEDQDDAKALEICEPEISAAESVMLAVGGDERAQAWEENVAQQNNDAPWFRNWVLEFLTHPFLLILLLIINSFIIINLSLLHF